MQIVDVCEFYSEHGGGVKTYVDQKIEASARLGADTTIIAPGPEDRRDRRRGGEVIWVKSPHLPFDSRYHMFWNSAPVEALLDDINPAVLEASSTWRGAWIAASWRGLATKVLFAHQDPVAVYPHTIFAPRLDENTIDKMCFWFWFYLRRLTARYDSIVVGGDWLAARFETFGLQRPIVAPMGVDKTLFRYELRDDETRWDMLRTCGVDNSAATLFVAVSRHHPEKRIGTLIDAFRSFTQTKPAALYLIGDGPSRKWVDAQASRVDGVHVAGPVRDRARLARMLASGDYFLHGGAAETFGLVVAEALASGLPLIAPSIGGAADLAHPTYAETYRAGDPLALLSAMHKIHRRDYDTLRLAARAGANRVNTPMDHFELLFEYYARLTEEKKSARAAA